MSAVKEFKCLTCKAPLAFDPPTGHWKCGYCFSEFEKEQLDSGEIVDELPDEDQPELDAYHCKSCGAELLADATTSATFCLYCKSPTIIKQRFSGRFKPKCLIPFRLTKEQAEELYKTWIKKRLLAPSAFKQKNEVEKITGIYAPYWLFDTTAEGTLAGDATRVRTWTQGDYNYTETKFYHVVRSGHTRYDNIPVDASKKLDDGLMQLIEPYNYKDMTDFSMQYMSGFMAEKYDVEAQEAERVMKKRADEYMQTRLRGTVSGYSSFSVKEKVLNLQNTTQDYAMLPIYLLINKFKDKEHAFIINGQTGKVVGDTPISGLRQLVFGASVFAAVWFIAVFGGALFG